MHASSVILPRSVTFPREARPGPRPINLMGTRPTNTSKNTSSFTVSWVLVRASRHPVSFRVKLRRRVHMTNGSQAWRVYCVVKSWTCEATVFWLKFASATESLGTTRFERWSYIFFPLRPKVATVAVLPTFGSLEALALSPTLGTSSYWVSAIIPSAADLDQPRSSSPRRRASVSSRRRTAAPGGWDVAPSADPAICWWRLVQLSTVLGFLDFFNVPRVPPHPQHRTQDHSASVVRSSQGKRVRCVVEGV